MLTRVRRQGQPTRHARSPPEQRRMTPTDTAIPVLVHRPFIARNRKKMIPLPSPFATTSPSPRRRAAGEHADGRAVRKNWQPHPRRRARTPHPLRAPRRRGGHARFSATRTRRTAASRSATTSAASTRSTRHPSRASSRSRRASSARHRVCV